MSASKEPIKLVGKRVVKDFLDEFTGEVRPFGGVLSSYSAQRRLFYVVYDDGDSEEVDLKDASALVKRADAENARVIEKESTGAPSTRNKINKSGTKTAPSPRSRPLPRKRARDEEDSWSSTDSESEDDYPSPSNSPSISSQDEDDSDDDSDDGFTINIGTIPTRKSPPSRRPSARENELPLANTAPAAAAVAAPKTKLKINDGASSSRPIDVAVAAATTTAAKATTTTTKTRQRAAPTRNKAKKSSKVTKRANLPDGLLPPEVQLNTRHQYAPGEEPWRKLQQHLAIPVHDALDLSPSAVGIVLKCKQLYYRNYRAAEVSEAVRVSAIPATATVRPSRRPDRVTESLMKAEGGGAVNQGKCVGYVPGIQMSQRFYARAEMACMGVHLPPVAGIEIAGKDVTGLGIPLALSIVVAGCYEDDADDGIELIFTGEGGNNLLGDKKQIGSQREVRGNAALVGNIRLGVPVRVTRKNRDPYGKYGCVLIFDGLYDVVEYWKVKGKEGFDVIQFRLIRRPGQGGLPSETVKFGGISAPKKLVPLSRPGIVDVDISGGKESLPIAAVNTTDDNDLPPCTALERVPLLEDLKAVHRGITNEALEALRANTYTPTVQYITEYNYTDGVPHPVGPILPPQFSDDPHAYITQLNHGRLPYLDNPKLPQLREALPVVYECGPWTGCALGRNCPQAASQRDLQYRLELFKTDDGRGWGVRSLDMIPQFAFVCNYFGDVYSSEKFNSMIEKGGSYHGEYAMDMAVRPDRDWEGNISDVNVTTSENAEFVVCGLHRRNIAAFINHSCAPNCFAQPVLSDHHDLRMPKISVFAAEDIAPLTQLTWDYGVEYVENKFEQGCKCGAVECVSVVGRKGGEDVDQLN